MANVAHYNLGTVSKVTIETPNGAIEINCVEVEVEASDYSIGQGMTVDGEHFAWVQDKGSFPKVRVKARMRDNPGIIDRLERLIRED